MADKKISELDLALQINNDAVFPMSQDNAGEPTTFKVGITQLGTEIAEDMTFSNLQTTSKKLVGAINELLSLGSPIIIGTTAPTSSIGADGNLYIQYTAGTGGADDEVDGIFVKIDGAWCEISTGGGSGTTDYEDLSNKPQVNSVELVGNKSLDDLGIMPASLSKTVSGSIAHFTDGGNNIPVKSLVSQIVAVETGSGEKSPDNPYTISGFDSGVITRCGKNLLNIDAFKDINNWSTTYPDGGNMQATTQNPVYTFGKLIAGETYTLSFEYAEPNFPQYLYFGYYGNDGVTTRLTYFTTNQIFNRTYTFTALENVNYCVRVQGSVSFDRNMSYINKCQLEYGSASEFEAYNGNNYTFTFGQTVYGGHFDNKGNLVITHGVVDLSEISTGGTASSGYVWYTTLNNPKTVPNTQIAPITSEKYNVIRYNAVASTINSIAIRDNGVLYVNNGSNTTQPSGIAVYELATPITLSITSQDIPTLFGENNIYSNTGDVEVDYYTDNADEIVEVVKVTASTPLHKYSTDEQVVGTWIDGSTVYEKSFTASFTNIPSGTPQDVVDISGLGINEVISSVGVCKYSAENQSDLYESLGLHFYCYIYPSGYLQFAQTMTSQTTGRTYDLKITIQYTKSST